MAAWTPQRRPEQESDMAASPSGQAVNPSTTSTARGRGRIAVIVIAAIAFLSAPSGVHDLIIGLLSGRARVSDVRDHVLAQEILDEPPPSSRRRPR